MFFFPPGNVDLTRDHLGGGEVGSDPHPLVFLNNVRSVAGIDAKLDIGESDLISHTKVKTAIAAKLLTSRHPKLSKM